MRGEQRESSERVVNSLFEEALGLIRDALTFGINPSLEPMQRICELLGNPQNKFVCIQVAGTNGKSSTSRYLAALLQAQGYTTGLYTSPELVSITDRIEINAAPIDEESFARAIIHVHQTARAGAVELTEFELITAAALMLYAKRHVTFAVLEVGLGGRWDATSVVTPQLVVFTGVALDHTAILGNTIAEIAHEKAAIIKGKPLVVAAPMEAGALEVFKARALDEGSAFLVAPAAKVQEKNSYQAQNKLTALTAARELLGVGSFVECKQSSGAKSLDESKQSSDGLKKRHLPELLGAKPFDERKAVQALDETTVPGRLEVVCKDPLIIIDAAHNPASARTLTEHFHLPGAHLLLAVLADKDARGIIEALAPHFACIAVTQTKSPRAIPASELAELVREVAGQLPRIFENTEAALAVFLKQSHPLIATGSITLAGEVKAILQS